MPAFCKQICQIPLPFFYELGCPFFFVKHLCRERVGTYAMPAFKIFILFLLEIVAHL